MIVAPTKYIGFLPENFVIWLAEFLRMGQYKLEFENGFIRFIAFAGKTNGEVFVEGPMTDRFWQYLATHRPSGNIKDGNGYPTTTHTAWGWTIQNAILSSGGRLVNTGTKTSQYPLLPLF